MIPIIAYLFIIIIDMKKEKSKITQAIISPLQKYVRPDLELADI